MGLTTKPTVKEWVRLPLVPVIVRLYVPATVELDVFTVNVEEPLPPVTELGLNVPVAPPGSPLTFKPTFPWKQSIGDTDTV